jgi:hypothetical protein
MADYFPLISRAVEGLGSSTGEARRALYERARAALVSQLRGIDPPLSEADITRERLALEDAIRKVEAEASRRARTEPRAPIAPRPAAPRPAPGAPVTTPAAPPAATPAPPPIQPRLPERPLSAPDLRSRTEPPRPDLNRRPAFPPPPTPPVTGQGADEASPAAPSSARDRLRNARTSPVQPAGMKGYRDAVDGVEELGPASARAARSARDTRDSYVRDDDAMPRPERIEPRFHRDEVHDEGEAEPLHTLEDPYGEENEAAYTEEGSPFPEPAGPEEHFEPPRPPRSYRGIARLAVIFIVLAGLVATVSWQWSNISALYQFISHTRARQTTSTAPQTSQPKFPGRVPQDQAGPGAATTTPAPQAGPAVAQRVVLYEEDSNDPQGKRFVGSAIWRTETVSPGSGLAPELQVRADIEIPERHMTVTFTLRRNTDQALPASHTIEIMFNLPPDFPGGGIANVPGVLMKESEQARGVPLAGLAVKVTNGFFLIGLSAIDADVQRNIQLLRDRPWFDIPVVYNNGGRAILALEKGPPGDRAFADAFAAWGVK